MIIWRIKMTQEQYNNFLVFMGRSTLNGKEVTSFQHVVDAVTKLYENQDKENK